MSRNSRIWQDSLSHITVYEGDVTECVKWLGWAKQKLQFMLHNTAGPLTATFNPVSDVLIRVDTRPNRIAIKTSGGYMESGFLDHLNTAIGNEDTYKPSIIRFNSFVEDTSNRLVNASRSRVVSNLDESLAVGCAEKLPEVVAQGTLAAYHFVSDPPAFCEPLKIRRLKRAQVQVPPSVYTGKLRLMVQGIYGSRRSDYTLDEINGTYSAKITLGDYSLQHSGVDSVGIVKSPKGAYWIIRMGVTAVSANRLTPKYSGVKDPYIPPKSEEYEDLVEAYTLAGMGVDPATVSLDVKTLPTALSDYPNVLAYGWKFNNAGDEAAIVVYGSQPGIPAKDSTGVSSTATGIKTKLLKVKFGWNDTDEPVIDMVTTVSTGSHLPYTQVKTFYPVTVLGQQMMQCLMVDYGSLGKYANLTAPLYCFYDKADTLQTVTVSNGGYRFVSAVDTRTYYYDETKRIVDGIGQNETGTLTPAHNETAPAGVAVPSKTYTGLPSYSGLPITYDKWTLTADMDGPTEVTEPYGSPPGNYVRYFLSPAAVPGWWYGTAPDTYQAYTAICIIPFYDAEAVLVGFDKRRDSSSYSAIENIWSGAQKRYEQQFWYWEDGPSDRWKYATGKDYPNWYEGGFGDWNNIGSLSGDALDTTVAAQNLVAPIRHQELDLVSRHGIENIYRDERILNPSAPRPVLDLTVLLEVPAIDPFFSQPISVTTSYSGAARWAVVGSIGGSKDWPDITVQAWSTPVGWA